MLGTPAEIPSESETARESSAPSLARGPDGVAAVLFDLDGTLIDTVELIRLSFRHATSTVLGEAIPDELTMAGVGRPLLRQFGDLAPGHEEELLRVYRAFNTAHHDELARAYPGTREALALLEGPGLPHGGRDEQGKGERRAWPERVRPVRVLRGHRDGRRRSRAQTRPVPAAVRGRSRCTSTWVIVSTSGDSPHDMLAAVAGGAVAVAALWGAFTADEVLMPGVPFALASISQLPELLLDDARPFAIGEPAARHSIEQGDGSET